MPTVVRWRSARRAAGRGHDVGRRQERGRRASAAGWRGRACRWRRSRRRTCATTRWSPPTAARSAGPRPCRPHACGLAPSVAFNPVLLKPGSDRQPGRRARPGGRRRSARCRTASARPRCSSVVTATLADLRSRYDVVVCEGAGCPAEINLRADRHREHGPGPAARPAGRSWSATSTAAGCSRTCSARSRCSTPADQALIAGFVVNKFRGDPALLAPGLDAAAGADRAADARRAAVGGRAVARRRGLAVGGHRRRARPAGPAARVAVAAGRGGPAAADLQRHRRRGAGRRAGRRGPVRDRAGPGSPTPTWSCCPASEGDRRGPGLAAGDRAGRRGRSRTPQPGRPVLGICGGYQMLGARSPTRTRSKARRASTGSACCDRRSRSRRTRPSAGPVGDGAGGSRCAATRSTTGGGARRRPRRCSRRGDGLPDAGRRARHALARAAGERRVPPRVPAPRSPAGRAAPGSCRAGHALRRRARRAARPARRPGRGAPRHRRAGGCDRSRRARRICRRVTSGLAGSARVSSAVRAPRPTATVRFPFSAVVGTTTCGWRCCSTPSTRPSAACWCAARRAPRSRRRCARSPRCCRRWPSCPAAGSPATRPRPTRAAPTARTTARGVATTGRRECPREGWRAAAPAAARSVGAAGRRDRGPARRRARPGAGADRGRQGLRARACSPPPTAACSTSTRSTCCTTTSSTCCSTPPRWAARTSSATGSRCRTRPGSCWSGR